MSLSLTCHIKELSLSIFVGGCHKKSEGEDKVENDIKQKMSTRFEYRKWVKKKKNEYSLDTNQTCPKSLDPMLYSKTTGGYKESLEFNGSELLC